MPLPDLFLQELKARTDISELVSSYVNLRRSGRNLVGLCPFHHEKTASFNVYPDNGSFYCFGCGVGGDVITFVRKIENGPAGGNPSPRGAGGRQYVPASGPGTGNQSGDRSVLLSGAPFQAGEAWAGLPFGPGAHHGDHPPFRPGLFSAGTVYPCGPSAPSEIHGRRADPGQCGFSQPKRQGHGPVLPCGAMWWPLAGGFSPMKSPNISTPPTRRCTIRAAGSSL